MNQVGSRSRGAVRLVSATREGWPVIGLFLLGAALGAYLLPWTPGYIEALWSADPSVLRTIRLIAAPIGVLFMIWIVPGGTVRAAIGLRVLGALYGRDAPRGVTLFSPMVFLGWIPRRRKFSPGTVVIRTWSEPAARAAIFERRYWVSIIQGETRLSFESSARFTHGDRSRLVSWLSARGIEAVPEGDPGVLD